MMEGKMAEYLIGVEVHNSDQVSSRPHRLLIGFAKLAPAGLAMTLMLGIEGALAFCPCGDGLCNTLSEEGGTCSPQETCDTCPEDCGECGQGEPSFDYKIHPGSLCQPALGDEALHFQRAQGAIFHQKVVNGQPVSLRVTCPIIRDRVPHAGQTSERTRLDVRVWFNGELTTTCRFHSIRENGSEVFVSPPQSTDPNQETQALFWQVTPEQTALDGTYSVNCDLPTLVFLLRYVVGEDLVTDDGF
jgi:hypothetical protein